MHAVQRELRQATAAPSSSDADGEPERELELARRLVDHRVDGLIVLPVGPPSGEWASIAQEVPDRHDRRRSARGHRPSARSCSTNDRGLEATLRHLGALGHRRVAVLSWAVETSPGRPAERAVANVAATLGLDCRIVPCAYSLNGSRPLAARAAVGPRPAHGDAVPLGLDRLRRVPGLRRAGARDPRGRIGRRLRRPSDLAPARPAAHLDDLGRRARGAARRRVPAGSAGRRRSGRAAAGARGASARDPLLDGSGTRPERLVAAARGAASRRRRGGASSRRSSCSAAPRDRLGVELGIRLGRLDQRGGQRLAGGAQVRLGPVAVARVPRSDSAFSFVSSANAAMRSRSASGKQPPPAVERAGDAHSDRARPPPRRS